MKVRGGWAKGFAKGLQTAVAALLLLCAGGALPAHAKKWRPIPQPPQVHAPRPDHPQPQPVDPTEPPAGAPPCLAKRDPLQIDNALIRFLKQTTPNQFETRAYVRGPIVEIYRFKNGHEHFAIHIGEPESTDPRERIEVIYNVDFGNLPSLRLGMDVVACGDYITSNAPTPQYQPSPDGALVHWVHAAKGSSSHESGFLMINGVVYGQRGINAELSDAATSGSSRHADF